jgi:hypothetical protein
MSKESELYFETAMTDLKAAEVLFNKSLFPQSIYFIQQSIEKGVKGMAISYSLLDSKRIKKEISHKASLVFKASFKRHSLRDNEMAEQEIDSAFQSINDGYNELQIEDKVSILLSMIDSMEQEHDNINQYVNKTFSVEGICLLIKKNMSYSSIKNLDSIIASSSFHKLLEFHIPIYKPKVVEYLLSLQKLFALNILFENDISQYRYPDLTNLKSPQQRFDENNMVCKSLKRIIKELQLIYETIIEHETINFFPTMINKVQIK